MRVSIVARRYLRLLRSLVHHARVEQEVDDELRFHLEMKIEESIRAGMTPEEARRAALLRFGGVDRVR